VVAQGVESEEIFEALSGLGCDAAQGNYLCGPLTGEELARWLDERGEPVAVLSPTSAVQSAEA
jgi:EAL domain-containing protein (putative c-di-GMP-specific phosphodiesterase class I)